MAFKTAAALAYKAGMPRPTLVLLEPIGHLKATVPDANMGDVMGEVNKRRGRVLGMEPAGEGKQTVEADVPMAEMHDFTTVIRQCTQGRGSFTFGFERYEERPPTWPRGHRGGPRQRPGNNHAKRVKVFGQTFFKKFARCGAELHDLKPAQPERKNQRAGRMLRSR